MSNQPSNRTPTTPDDWGIPRPENIPRPTIFPPALALGATLMVWGLISSLIITVFGVVVFTITLAGWIKEIRHERRK